MTDDSGQQRTIYRLDGGSGGVLSELNTTLSGIERDLIKLQQGQDAQTIVQKRLEERMDEIYHVVVGGDPKQKDRPLVIQMSDMDGRLTTVEKRVDVVEKARAAETTERALAAPEQAIQKDRFSWVWKVLIGFLTLLLSGLVLLIGTVLLKVLAAG